MHKKYSTENPNENVTGKEQWKDFSPQIFNSEAQKSDSLKRKVGFRKWQERIKS